MQLLAASRHVSLHRQISHLTFLLTKLKDVLWEWTALSLNPWYVTAPFP